MSTAIVIGGTGLVGKCLVQQLLTDPAYDRVVALARRASGVAHQKYQEHVVDFERPSSFAEWVKGDVLFSCLGTTRAQAGSLTAQRKVDYDYQWEVAKVAAQQAVRSYVLVSSTRADPSSRSAYLKMKGELERDVQALAFPALHILQPGLLTGKRDKLRLGEGLGESVVSGLNALGLFKNLSPISGEQVARAMRHAATLPGRRTHGAEALFKLAAAASTP